MDKKFNGTTVETNGVRSIAGGGTGAATAEQARINLGITGGVSSYNDLTDKPSLGTAAATEASDYATAAQGVKADSALQSGAAISDISDLQAALDGKQAAGAYAPDTDISPSAITGTAVVDSDPRLADSRQPIAHKSSHATGGADALTPADIGAAASSHTHPLSQLEQSSATNGQVPVWDATTSAWVPQTPASGGIPTANVQIFATTGSTTWTKPPNAKSVNIQLFGAGGGGGGGRKNNTAATVKAGGGGGGGGSYLNINVPASVLGVSESVTIGAGGTAGVAATATIGNGGTGGAGGNTIFGAFICFGGGGGSINTTGAANGGGGFLNANAGGASVPAADANGGSPTSATVTTQYGGAGGGGGGSVTTASFAGRGADGGRSNVLNFAGGLGGLRTGNPTTLGQPGTNNTLASTGLFAVGSGGGGGGAGIVVSGGAGGTGGFPAGGGGGGGATETGTTSGAGGVGGAGMAIITTYF
jgi:hypothetical protein